MQTWWAEENFCMVVYMYKNMNLDIVLAWNLSVIPGLHHSGCDGWVFGLNDSARPALHWWSLFKFWLPHDKRTRVQSVESRHLQNLQLWIKKTKITNLIKYTTVQNLGLGKIPVFERSIMINKGCMNLFKNTVNIVILWNIFTIKNNCFNAMLILPMLKTVVLINIFVEVVINYFSKILWWMKVIENHLFEK